MATSAADLELLSGLLSGAVVLDGLAVDTDLRWTLLRRLVSRGVLGEAEIDAELSADATDAGERHAATCRAAVPTAEAKRETWETLTGGKLTIAMFRATLVGFVEPDQEALDRPYRPAYFAAVGDVWREWSSAMAQDFVITGYHVCAVDDRDGRGHRRVPGRRLAAGGAAPAAQRGPRRRAQVAPQPGPRPRAEA